MEKTKSSLKTRRGPVAFGAPPVSGGFLTASRVARNASPEEEHSLAKGLSAAVLAFLLADRFAVTKAKVFLLSCFASRATHRGIG